MSELTILSRYGQIRTYHLFDYDLQRHRCFSPFFLPSLYAWRLQHSLTTSISSRSSLLTNEPITEGRPQRFQSHNTSLKFKIILMALTSIHGYKRTSAISFHLSLRLRSGGMAFISSRRVSCGSNPLMMAHLSRYYVNDTFYKGDSDAPVYLCVGGEGPPLDGSVVVSSVHCNVAVEALADTNAIMFALEHRSDSIFSASSFCHCLA